MEELVVEKINSFLLKKWDPIGVNNMIGAEDEYLQYAEEVYQIIRSSDSYEKLFNYLWEVETGHMGLRGNRNHTAEFAKWVFNEVKFKFN